MCEFSKEFTECAAVAPFEEPQEKADNADTETWKVMVSRNLPCAKDEVINDFMGIGTDPVVSRLVCMGMNPSVIANESLVEIGAALPLSILPIHEWGLEPNARQRNSANESTKISRVSPELFMKRFKTIRKSLAASFNMNCKKLTSFSLSLIK